MGLLLEPLQQAPQPIHAVVCSTEQRDLPSGLSPSKCDTFLAATCNRHLPCRSMCQHQKQCQLVRSVSPRTHATSSHTKSKELKACQLQSHQEQGTEGIPCCSPGRCWGGRPSSTQPSAGAQARNLQEHQATAEAQWEQEHS
eukprot:scaffold11509_cov23-Tisochrysis_lutea.AAC.1